MGGWIVQLVAAEHPERVRRLMLFDSAGIYVKPTWDTRLFTPDTPVELKEFYALLMPNPPKLPSFVANDILRHVKENAWIIRQAMQTMLTGHDVTDKLLPGLKMPVLIVWGEQDQITPLSEGETMHHLVPQSELDVIPGCGHLGAGSMRNRDWTQGCEFPETIAKLTVLFRSPSPNYLHASGPKKGDGVGSRPLVFVRQFHYKVKNSILR